MCHYLEERNLRCFVAYRDIPKGKDWAPYIEKGFEDSKVLVYVHTESSNESIETTREINLAFEEGCVVIPFRVDSIKYGEGKRYRLNNVNWLDAFPGNPENYFGDLFDILKVHFPERIQQKEDEQARLDAEKAEAERIKREKEEAEQREEEVEQREEEVELRKAERKAWWQRHKSKFAIALAVIALSVTGLLIYLNWDYSLKTLTGHSDYVYSVAVSPDGKYLASGSLDETLIIWDAKSGQCLKTLKGHSIYVFSVCWSPDGKYLASGSDDHTVIIWDANSGEKLKTLYGHSSSVESVSWSPDGKYLASGSDDKTIIIWDANSGESLKTLKGHSDAVLSVCWSPDGKYLASGAWDNTVIIWDAESGEKLKTLAGHHYGV